MSSFIRVIKYKCKHFKNYDILAININLVFSKFIIVNNIECMLLNCENMCLYNFYDILMINIKLSITQMYNCDIYRID